MKIMVPISSISSLSLLPGLGRSAGKGIGYPLQYSWASLVTQLVKNPPLMWETWVRCLAWEYPLEKGKATQRIPVFWPAELFHGLYSSWGCKESDTTEWLSLTYHGIFWGHNGKTCKVLQGYLAQRKCFLKCLFSSMCCYYHHHYYHYHRCSHHHYHHHHHHSWPERLAYN